VTGLGPIGSYQDPVQRRRENQLLAEFAETRSPRLRAELVERFLPLARSLALRYRGGTEPDDDLLQVASLGLVKSLERFEPERGTAFAAFASVTILGELRRHLRDHVRTVRLPRGLQEMASKVESAKTDLTSTNGRSPTPSEVAEAIGTDVESVLEALEADFARRTHSLDAPRIIGEESTAKIDTLGAPELGYERVESDQCARSAQLDEREMTVLRLSLGSGLKQREIGAEIGVSQMQVSRIARGAMLKLLSAVRGERDGSTVVPAAVSRAGGRDTGASSNRRSGNRAGRDNSPSLGRTHA
jgi:RNA polymerase sigma-B factor